MITSWGRKRRDKTTESLAQIWLFSESLAEIQLFSGSFGSNIAFSRRPLLKCNVSWRPKLQIQAFPRDLCCLNLYPKIALFYAKTVSSKSNLGQDSFVQIRFSRSVPWTGFSFSLRPEGEFEGKLYLPPLRGRRFIYRILRCFLHGTLKNAIVFTTLRLGGLKTRKNTTFHCFGACSFQNVARATFVFCTCNIFVV